MMPSCSTGGNSADDAAARAAAASSSSALPLPPSPRALASAALHSSPPQCLADAEAVAVQAPQSLELSAALLVAMSYGTITNNNALPDLDPSTSASRPTARRPSGVPTEKLKIMSPQGAVASSSRTSGDESDDDDVSHYSAQVGVKRLEAISSTWSRWGLFAAYFGVCLLAYATSLEGQTTVNLTIYATSAFKAHSLVATVLVVQGVVLSVVKPPMSKIADVFGRFEAFTLSVLIYSVGYVQQAASNNVQTYAAAQIFYSAGSTGLQILIQIFIADTSDLVNRALCSTLPALPFLVNVWIGSPLADMLLKQASWRWGYGIWAIVLPVAYLPLALALYTNQRKAAKRGLLPPSPFRGLSYWNVVKHLWFELDVFGLILLCAAFSLLLIPLTLAAKNGWNDPNLLAMLFVGAVCLAVFPFWERSKKMAPRAFFPGSLFRNKTVLAGLGISFFYFMAYYLSVYPYFQSYLLVVQNQSVTGAGRIVQMWTFAATITSFCVSILIKYTKHYKFFVTLGAIINFLGLLLMIFYRVENASTASLVATTAIVGIGGGMLNVPAQLGVQASANHQEVGAATAIFLTFLEIGGAVGSAISGAIWTASVPKKLATYLPPETKDQAMAIYSNIGLASTGWPMGSPTRIAINRAYQETMTNILMVAACVAVPVILLSFLMENYKLDEIEQHVKGVVIGTVQEPTSIRRQSSAYFEDEVPAFRASTDSAIAEEEPMLQRTLSRGSRRSRKGL
ncbi:hypothetical protein Q7P37_008174 [Cladosporium fusiforme]